MGKMNQPNIYRRERTSVTLINSHFVWIPVRRKKILVGDIAKRLEELIYQIMFRLKGYSSRVLRKEYPHFLKLPSLWTRSYFCGPGGNVSSDTIKRYIANQRTC